MIVAKIFAIIMHVLIVFIAFLCFLLTSSQFLNIYSRSSELFFVLNVSMSSFSWTCSTCASVKSLGKVKLVYRYRLAKSRCTIEKTNIVNGSRPFIIGEHSPIGVSESHLLGMNVKMVIYPLQAASMLMKIGIMRRKISFRL